MKKILLSMLSLSSLCYADTFFGNAEHTISYDIEESVPQVYKEGMKIIFAFKDLGNKSLELSAIYNGELDVDGMTDKLNIFTNTESVMIANSEKMHLFINKSDKIFFLSIFTHNSKSPLIFTGSFVVSRKR